MTDANGDESSLPTLAYVYRPGSFDTLALRDAARGCCRLAWVLDSTAPGVEDAMRLLRRLGEVIDVAGCSLEEAAGAIAVVRPAGILALADEALVWTADVAAALALPFHSPSCARRLTDKHLQREALALGGCVVPKSWVLAAGADDDVLARIEGEVAFPAVLKPRTGEGSKDTLPIGSAAELRTCVAQLGATGVPGRQLVLEEYIEDAEGPVGGEGFAGYLSVESAVAGGVTCHLATNGRMPPAHPFRETGFFIPSALGGEALEDVWSVATAAIAALGVTVGCLHTEIKLTPSGPVVIEVNGRIGGGVPEMLERASGVRLLTLAMRLALGEVPACEGPVTTERVAYLFYVHAPAAVGVVTAVEGVAEVRAAAGVEEVVLRRVPGDRVDWREGNHGHVLSVFGSTGDHDGLRAVKALLERTLRIEVA